MKVTLITSSIRSIACYILIAGSGTAQALILAPVADTTVRTDYDIRSIDNYGMHKTLDVGTGRGGGGRPYGSPDAFRVLLAFDPSQLPSDPVEMAILQLTVFAFVSSRSSYDISIHKITEPWSEGIGYEGPNSTTQGIPPGAEWVHGAPGVNWWTQPDFDSVSIVSSHLPPSVNVYGQRVSWDVTSAVNDWITGASPNYGFLLHDIGTEGNFRVVAFGAREGDWWDFPGVLPHPVMGPRLVISERVPVPEPSHLGFLALAIAWGVRRVVTGGSRARTESGDTP